MKTLFLIFILAISSNVFAYVSSNGDEFKIEYNENGAILKSVNNPSSKMNIDLGKDCDAFSKVYGKGKWEWANGGFFVEFPNKRFAFGRQEIDINNGACMME